MLSANHFNKRGIGRMLLEEENLLVGKLIALLNGLDEVENSAPIEDFIRRALRAICENQSLKNLISEAEQLKRIHLYQCFLCKEKCGRTEDFFLNSILPLQIRELKSEKYLQFKDAYTEQVSFKDIVYRLTSLSW